MKRTLKYFLILFSLLILVISYFSASTGAGFLAKNICSDLFVVGKKPAAALVEAQLANTFLRLFKVDYDLKQKWVKASLFFQKNKAIYREKFGCSLLSGMAEVDFQKTKLPKIKKIALSENIDWPYGSRKNSDNLPQEKLLLLDTLIERAFKEVAPSKLRNTRAILIAYKGKLIREKYADGFSKDSLFLGWSMTKSVMASLIGIAVQDKLISLEQRNLLDTWVGNEKADISVKNLLHMESGLAMNERYALPFSEVNRMLFSSQSVSSYADSRKLKYKPGEHWSYSSGDSNILSYLLFKSLEDDTTSYLGFPHDQFFSKLNMNSPVFETDAKNIFIASSNLFMTARDWARFGQLYLNQGKWKNEQILSKEWISFAKKPSTKASYGAQFWLNLKNKKGEKFWPDIPEDAFSASGHYGQVVLVIPSKKIVIVRLGLTIDRNQWDMNSFSADILKAI